METTYTETTEATVPLSKQDLWSFIQTKRATQSASLKVLQRFVLSLSKKELRHMIESYLKSKLSSHDFTPTTRRHCFETVIPNTFHGGTDVDSWDIMDTMDQNILYKMSEQYGQRYNKRIIANMQQHTSQTKPRLISFIPAQVLTYSFQYLSFRELCKIERVSSYFTYLHHAYRNLSHYFISLDARFWHKAMRNQINLTKLSQFKHIKIGACYRGPWHRFKYKNRLFEHILSFVIYKSITCLDTLEIDVPKEWMCGKEWTSSYGSFTVLNHILSSFNPLPISKLIWKKDTFISHHISERIAKLAAITQNLLNRCKNIKHLYFGVNNFGRQRVHDQLLYLCPAADLTRHIILPVIRGYPQLQTLELHCPSWNIFEPQHRIIEAIAQLEKLQKLVIVSHVDGDHEYTNMIPKEIKNVSVKELSVEFGLPMTNSTNNHSFIHTILLQLFSTFIGITDFHFAFATFTHSPRFFGSFSGEVSLNIDWYRLFSHLWQEKIQCSVSRLESLQIDTICFKDAYTLLKDLRLLKDAFYLKHFGIHVVGGRSHSRQHDVFCKFVNNCLVPFLLQYKDSVSLKSLDIGYGCGYKLHEQSGDQWHTRRAYSCPIQIEPSYYEPIFKLLSSLPDSLERLNLKPPGYYTGDRKERRQIRETESLRLVQRLCQILSEKTDTYNLESLSLQRIDLQKKAKNFLLFIFGFNNKFHFQDNTYYLSFN
eukprot:97332_1